MDTTDVPTKLALGGSNAVGRMLSLLGDEWTLLIVQQALLGATRYGEFKDRLPISNSVLSARLRVLADGDLLSRNVYQSNPVRAEYLITPRSRSLWPVLLSIWDWERHWVECHAEPLPAMRHTSCGSDFSPVLLCRSCSEQVTEKDIIVGWGPSGSWARSVPEAMTRRRSEADQQLSVARLFPETMSVFGNRWAAALLVAALVGTTRFTDFQTQLAAPPGSISHRLQVFCSNGVLTAANGYRLTEKGRAFFPVLITALQWGQQWFHSDEGPAVLLTHRGCGGPFAAVLACDQCMQTLAGSQVATVTVQSEP